MTAGEHYIGKIVVDQHTWTQDASWLVSPMGWAVVLLAIATFIAPRLVKLRGGSPG